MTRFVAIFYFMLVHSACLEAQDATPDDVRLKEPPLEAVLLRYGHPGKPPLPCYEMRLTIQNCHDHPCWFLVPYYADVALNESGKFASQRRDGIPFDVYELEGDGGKIIAVGMHGPDRSGFYAFRIPANGKIIWQNWTTLAKRGSDKVTELDAWEVTDLMVNGTTKLERWLPYEVMSSKDVTVKDGGPFSSWSVNRRDLNWDREKGRRRADLPTEKVEMVKAEGVSRWKVRLDGGAQQGR